jgi:hypothetical protein
MMNLQQVTVTSDISSFFFAMQAVKPLSRCETYTDCPKTQDPASFIGGIEVWLKACGSR